MYVKNTEELVDHGYRDLRRQLLDTIEIALHQVDPYHLTKQLVRISGRQLLIGDLQFDLRQLGAIRVVGAGKATFPIAKALEDILGDHISEGLIIVKEDETRNLSRIKVARASHPIPNEAGYLAAREILNMASSSRDGDLYLVAVTGGSSALMPYPVEGISLEDKRQINRLLLGCGATIGEINAVRKHLSQIKGGCLAKTIGPAEIVNLTISDVIGDPLDCITDPTVTDSSTFADAINVLKKHDIWDIAPDSVKNHLSKGSPEEETLKEYGTLRVHNFIMANNKMAAEAARAHLQQRRYNSTILSTSLQGESRDVGYVLASISSETIQHNRPFKRPASYVCAGETTVKLEEETGNNPFGGPSQELAVAVALRLPDKGRVAGVFLDTDGSDGPTKFAGALVDSETREHARTLGVDLQSSLKNHEVTKVLNRLSDAILTGATGTNVMDLAVLIVV